MSHVGVAGLITFVYLVIFIFRSRFFFHPSGTLYSVFPVRQYLFLSCLKFRMYLFFNFVIYIFVVYFFTDNLVSFLCTKEVILC